MYYIDKHTWAKVKCSCKRSDRKSIFLSSSILQAKLETKALKAKRPGFTDDRYNETAYFVENGEPYKSNPVVPRRYSTYYKFRENTPTQSFSWLHFPGEIETFPFSREMHARILYFFHLGLEFTLKSPNVFVPIFPGIFWKLMGSDGLLESIVLSTP